MIKKAIFVVIWTHKKAKTQNIKKSPFEVLEGTLRNISTRNWGNWTFFEKMHTFSVENFFPKFLTRRQKNGCFLPKNRAIFGRNLKILEINKNHLNTPYIQIIGHLKSFWLKN